MVYEYALTIREAHLDTFGHVNNATYLELYEEARWEMIQAGAWGLERIQNEKKGPVIVELHLTFKKELKNRSRITIQTRFKEMKGNKLMVLEQAMVNDAGEIASTLELVIGMMDLNQRKLIAPPADWLSAVGAEHLKM
jgi:acyl-CoA thioester hydrolase